MKNSLLLYTVLSAFTGTIVISTTHVAAADLFSELEAETTSSAQSPEDLQKEFEKYQQAQQAEYADYKKKLLAEFDQYKTIYREETQKYQDQVATVWDAPELSSKKVWVEYSDDIKTKSRVDFEQGVIQIATTGSQDKPAADKTLRAQLKTLLMKNQAEAFQDDKVAQAIEQKSKEKLTYLETATVKPTPILLPLVSTSEEPSEQEVDKIVDELISQKVEKIEKNTKGVQVVTIQVPLGTPESAPTTNEVTERKAKPMADLRVHKLPKGAREVAPTVQNYAGKVNLDEALVFAIIETESAFNPMAKSPIPAYGLMQIVPSSAGMDVTEMLFGKARILSPSYLFASEKNIEVGATYLHILQYRYLKGIDNPLSRLYCSIAAYNTGAGNVSKAFTGNTKLRNALPIINQMAPQEVYNHLLKNLPYDETKQYLKKVVSRMEKYSA